MKKMIVLACAVLCFFSMQVHVIHAESPTPRPNFKQKLLDLLQKKRPSPQPSVEPAIKQNIPTTSSIYQYGITWTFAKPVQYGQFVNGDYWVVKPVELISINPSSTMASTGRVVNGSEINPNPSGKTQGYDSSMRYNKYDSLLNVGLGINEKNPLVIKEASSLVSTISRQDAGVIPQIQVAAVLTILDAPPVKSDAFRPPYCGLDKTITHYESDIDYSVLKSLKPTASAPPLGRAVGYFSHVWLDYRSGVGGRMMHPVDNMLDYGRDMSARIGEVALLLNCDFTNSDKRKLLVNLLQYGIDLWGVIQTGFKGWWQDGGHGGGRKFPILFSGVVLGDSDMANVGHLPYQNPVFGEDQTTIYMTQKEATRWLGADGKYRENNTHRDRADAYYSEADWNYRNLNGQMGIPEYSKWNGTKWQGRWISRLLGASYRQCCHVNGFTGWLLAARVMGLQKAWNHDALFDYADRYLEWSEKDGRPLWQRHWSKFAGEMWDKYRPMY